MDFTTNPELRLMNTDTKNPAQYKFMDYSSKKYYTVIRDSKIITFDSGESTLRRKYLESTLAHVLNIKGVPCVVISTLDPTVTKLFLNKIPQNIRSKILNIGLFHTYLRVQEQFRSILEELCISKEYRPYMQMFFSALRSIQTDLLTELSRLGILVLLDRSMISNYLYVKALTQHQKGNWDWSELYNLDEFRPYFSFYVHAKDLPGSFKLGSMYDSEEGINDSLRTMLPFVKKKVPLVELDSVNTFEQNMEIIRSTLSSI